MTSWSVVPDRPDACGSGGMLRSHRRSRAELIGIDAGRQQKDAALLGRLRPTAATLDDRLQRRPVAARSSLSDGVATLLEGSSVRSGGGADGLFVAEGAVAQVEQLRSAHRRQETADCQALLQLAGCCAASHPRTKMDAAAALLSAFADADASPRRLMEMSDSPGPSRRFAQRRHHDLKER